MKQNLKFDQWKWKDIYLDRFRIKEEYLNANKMGH